MRLPFKSVDPGQRRRSSLQWRAASNQLSSNENEKTGPPQARGDSPADGLQTVCPTSLPESLITLLALFLRRSLQNAPCSLPAHGGQVDGTVVGYACCPPAALKTTEG